MLDQEGEGRDGSLGFVVGWGDEEALGEGKRACAESVDSSVGHCIDGDCRRSTN